MNIKYFSTFSGVAGFEIRIQKAIPGAICVGMSEIDKHASNVMECVAQRIYMAICHRDENE